jgi:serine/threonine protein kinase
VRAVSPELRWRIEITGWDLLCFDHVDGRGADYRPGSPDLPHLVATMRRLAELSCPDLPLVYFRRAEQRWAEAISDPAARGVLAGDTILHTDYNPANILITRDGAEIIDLGVANQGCRMDRPRVLDPPADRVRAHSRRRRRRREGVSGVGGRRPGCY